jgi:hypothetical protein
VRAVEGDGTADRALPVVEDLHEEELWFAERAGSVVHGQPEPSERYKAS